MEDKIVTIEKIVFGGKGLTRDLGKIALVPFTLPGEKVRIRVVRERKDYSEAEVLEILEPSPDRIAPACRYFGHCGGCHISHANYETQAKWKEAILKETFERSHLRLPKVEVITAEPLHYRHRARLQYDSRTGAIGFCERDSNRVVNVNECLCLTPALNRLLANLQKTLQGKKIARLREIQCFENDRQETVVYFDAPLPPPVKKALEAETRVVDGKEMRGLDLTLRFRELELPMRPDIFLQVNPRLWKAMIQEIESHHSQREPALRVAVELYCGAGFFTVPLAQQFDRIVACEENAAAIHFAKKSHASERIQWVRSRAEDFRFPADSTALIVDPPRAGLPKSVTKRILEHGFQRISYVSCDCTSLARDVKALSDNYYISRMNLFDLFPQTFHFETIALLERMR